MVPCPTDYRTSGGDGLSVNVQPLFGLMMFSDALHEWVGLFAYWMLDRSDALFPAQ